MRISDWSSDVCSSDLFRRSLTPGDEIIVTDQDHEANSGVWRRLADDGIVVREWRVDRSSGSLDPAALDILLNERTRLVAFTHCSNLIAEINPVDRKSTRLLQSLMRISYAVFCLKKKNNKIHTTNTTQHQLITPIVLSTHTHYTIA